MAHSGKLFTSGYTIDPHVGNPSHITSNVINVGPTPATAMSLIAIRPTPATMAFGGVPTGMWKAKLQDMAAGSIRYSGWVWITMAWKKFKVKLYNVENVNPSSNHFGEYWEHDVANGNIRGKLG